MRLLSYCAGAAALLSVSSRASAATLLDQVNIPEQYATSVSLPFTATSTSTTIDFQGYDIPSTIVLVNIELTGNGGSTNLLGLHFNYTPAACGAFAGEGSLGSHGTNDLTFGGGCVGSYDSLAQTVSTSIGASYTLSFVFSAVGVSRVATPNGLRIFANGPTVAAVPEPATWGMMLVGFAGMGLVLRRRRRRELLAAAI